MRFGLRITPVTSMTIKDLIWMAAGLGLSQVQFGLDGPNGLHNKELGEILNICSDAEVSMSIIANSQEAVAYLKGLPGSSLHATHALYIYDDSATAYSSASMLEDIVRITISSGIPVVVNTVLAEQFAQAKAAVLHGKAREFSSLDLGVSTYRDVALEPGAAAAVSQGINDPSYRLVGIEMDPIALPDMDPSLQLELDRLVSVLADCDEPPVAFLKSDDNGDKVVDFVDYLRRRERSLLRGSLLLDEFRP